MAGERIETVISAVDDFSATMNRYKQALGESEFAAASAGQGTDKLSKKLADLTDANDWAATGVKKFKNVLEGLAFGGAIGAVSAVTASFVTYYHETLATQQQIDKLNDSVMNQAKAWKLLPEPIGAVSAATVDLYNAELKYLQLQERGKGEGLERYVKTLEQVKRTMEENPEWAGNFGNSIEQIDVKLAEARIKHNEWLQLMKLTPATVSSITSSLEAAAVKSSDLKLPEGGGSLAAFILGDLDMAKERVGFQGLELGKAFAAAAATGMATRPTGDLQFNIADYFAGAAHEESTAAIDAAWENELALEEVYRNMALRRVEIEESTQAQLRGLRFAAANDAVGLLYIMGRESKAAAMAALVLHKGLSMAQIWISGLAASARAEAELGPIAGTAMAAKIMLWTKLRMGLVAATGIAEAATGGGAPSGVGGGGGVGALPITPPSRADEPRGTQHITVNVYNPLSEENWQRIVDDNIKPALENLSGERNVELNIKVARR